jgi:hypothetical protein
LFAVIAASVHGFLPVMVTGQRYPNSARQTGGVSRPPRMRHTEILAASQLPAKIRVIFNFT